MATMIEIGIESVLRDPREVSFADLTGGKEPVGVFEVAGRVLIVFAETLGPDQQGNIRARVVASEAEDALRRDVLDAAPVMQTIINSTGTLTAAQLSDAARALAKAVYAIGRLVLFGTRS